MASVASVTAQDLTATPAAFAKPTGLAVGDILVAAVYSLEDINTPSGWTEEESAGSLFFGVIFTKVADSSDVAASTFTFTSAGTSAIGGVVMRVTSGDQFDPGGVSTTVNDTDTSPLVFAPSLTPSFNGAVIVALVKHDSTLADNVFSSPTGGSLSWTIRHQENNFGSDESVAICTATKSDTVTLGAFSITVSKAAVDGVLSLLEVRSQVDGPVSVNRETVNVTDKAFTTSSSTNVTIGKDTVNVTDRNPTVAGSNPTVWTTTDKS